jgi:hypothetical protein
MSCSQVADLIIKKMKEKKHRNLYTFLSQFDVTAKGAAYFKGALNFNLNIGSVQRTRVVLGKILAKLIAAEFTFDLYETGFRRDLVDNALEAIGNDLTALLASLTQFRLISVVEDYRDNSDWKLHHASLKS